MSPALSAVCDAEDAELEAASPGVDLPHPLASEAHTHSAQSTKHVSQIMNRTKWLMGEEEVRLSLTRPPPVA